jgi:hypothetical protein
LKAEVRAEMNVDNGGYVNMQAAEMTVKNTAEMNVDSGGHVNMQAAEMTVEVTLAYCGDYITDSGDYSDLEY